MSDDTDRLHLIVKAFLHCKQEITREALAGQFRYETGREAPAEALERILRKEGA